MPQVQHIVMKKGSCISCLTSFNEGFKGEIDKESGKNAELHEDVMLQYAGTAYVGIIEWWISPQVMAKQVGTLLERSL